MSVFVTGVVLASIGFGVLVLLVSATIYIRPEQTGLSVRIRKDRIDLIMIVGMVSLLIIYDFLEMIFGFTTTSGGGRIALATLNVVTLVLSTTLLISSWRYGYRRKMGTLPIPK